MKYIPKNESDFKNALAILKPMFLEKKLIFLNISAPWLGAPEISFEPLPNVMKKIEEMLFKKKE